MAWIESSPELLRRDGRGRDSGKKGRKGERGSVGGDADVRAPHVSGRKKKRKRFTVCGETGRWGRDVRERKHARWLASGVKLAVREGARAG